MNKPYCPILTIGFAAPEEGQRDLRRCTKECAWFDHDEDCCAIISLLETTSGTNETLAEVESFLFDKQLELAYSTSDYEYDANSTQD